MKTKLIDCPSLADSILRSTQASALAFEQRTGRRPALAVVLVGEDPGSKIYVAKKSETCRAFGMEARDISLPASTSQAELEARVLALNEDDSVDGILVQSPLPAPLDQERIQRLIAPEKDVDCFHPQNVGELTLNPRRAFSSGLVPCTPAGVIEVLNAEKIPLRGAKAVVLGRSNIVGKPMALLLSAFDATVTICHSQTRDLEALCLEADILVAAIGRPKFVNSAHVKPGAIVVDVGINRVERDGKIRVVGDVDATSIQGIAAALTPVPKGIGPMTISLLLRNTCRAAQRRCP